MTTVLHIAEGQLDWGEQSCVNLGFCACCTGKEDCNCDCPWYELTEV